MTATGIRIDPEQVRQAELVARRFLSEMTPEYRAELLAAQVALYVWGELPPAMYLSSTWMAFRREIEEEAKGIFARRNRPHATKWAVLCEECRPVRGEECTKWHGIRACERCGKPTSAGCTDRSTV